MTTVPHALSQRELEVAGMVAQGLSNKQIADRLCIAYGTVKIHVGRILSKSGAKNRTQFALSYQYAHRHIGDEWGDGA